MKTEKFLERIKSVWGRENPYYEIISCIEDNVSDLGKSFTIMGIKKYGFFGCSHEDFLKSLVHLTVPSVNCLTLGLKCLYPDGNFVEMKNVSENLRLWELDKPYVDPMTGELEEDWSKVHIYFSTTDEFRIALKGGGI